MDIPDSLIKCDKAAWLISFNMVKAWGEAEKTTKNAVRWTAMGETLFLTRG